MPQTEMLVQRDTFMQAAEGGEARQRGPEARGRSGAAEGALLDEAVLSRFWKTELRCCPLPPSATAPAVPDTKGQET
ncbi:hypothetical protein [Streptomyces sp. NPDC001816]|uniref:hypothetical protein n=1 Tax=Streptomyces sp. NPDC001816 TaxID=3364612 RepID=UPI0036D1AAEC